jgi:hypothetical protein
MKTKTYLANSVLLRRVPDEHRASNGNCQFTIVVRAKSQKQVAELIGPGCSLGDLRDFCGIHEAGPKHASIPQRDGVIYYHVEHTKHGYVGKWFEYQPADRLQKIGISAP